MKKTMLSTIALVVTMTVALTIGSCYSTEETVNNTSPTEPPLVLPGDLLPDCTAGFSWNQAPGTLSVGFINQSSPSECDESFWHFGDATGTSREHSPSHKYLAPGDYVARLTICPTTDQSRPECSDVSQVVVVAPVPAV